MVKQFCNQKILERYCGLYKQLEQFGYPVTVFRAYIQQLEFKMGIVYVCLFIPKLHGKLFQTPLV